MKQILDQLCKYMNENEEKLSNGEWSKLYQAKELIKEAMQEETTMTYKEYLEDLKQNVTTKTELEEIERQLKEMNER